jgi:signal transduction histidine kinase
MTGELRQLDEAKRRIIADSAHELRTPVTLIRGTIEAMLDGVYPADEAHLRSVHEETIRLSELIDALRELELIDSGEIKLNLVPVDVGRTLEKAAALFKTSASEKGIDLILDPGLRRDLTARADLLRLDEVLYNLIANSIKYVPRGGTVELSAAPTTKGVLISVDDSGPGIPLGERARIFERYYRMDKSRAQDTGGRGLGLAIAFEIVRAHGGTISAGESRLGGASFRVELPASRD